MSLDDIPKELREVMNTIGRGVSARKTVSAEGYELIGLKCEGMLQRIVDAQEILDKLRQDTHGIMEISAGHAMESYKLSDL